MTFVNDKKENVGFSDIDENNKYSISKLPRGDYTVCVETESLKPPDPMVLKNQPPADVEGFTPPNWAERAKRYTPIPSKYSQAEQSPLKVKVTGGTQSHDIKLD